MKISVIIATYKRNDSLGETLEHFLKLRDFDSADFEIIIADNSPTFDSRDIIKKYDMAFAGRLKSVHEPKKGKSFAVNKAIPTAFGEIIAFTDDDVIVDPMWIKNMRAVFMNYPCDALGGRILPRLPEASPQWVRDHLDMLGGPVGFHDVGEDIKFYSGNMPPFAGANLAIKKHVLQELGGYKTELGAGTGVAGEDSELFHRLIKSQKKVLYAGNVLTWHKVERSKLNLAHIAKWAISSGQYDIYTNKNTVSSKRQFLGAPLYFYRQLFCEIFILPFQIFNQRRFLIHWKYFFRLYGKTIAHIRLRNRNVYSIN
jgi:GT2 family glycosyltransferase